MPAKNEAPCFFRTSRIFSALSESCGASVWRAWSSAGGEKRGKRFGEIERDAAVAIADLFEADPDDFTGGHDGVEIAGAIVGDARGENFAFEFGDEKRGALEIFDGVEKRVEATAARGDSLPARGEAREGALLDGFDFAAEAGEALAANLLEDFGVAPFLMLAARAEFAFEEFSFAVKRAKNGVDLRGLQCVARGEFLRGEWAVGARVAADEFAERIFAGGEEDFGEAGRERSAECVAIAAGVFDGDEAGFAGDSNADGAARVGEIGDRGCDRGRRGTRGDFGFGEVAVFEEEVVDAVGVAGLIVGLERLEAAFDFVDGVLVEEFAEVGVAEDFLELRLIDRERLGAAFGERGVAVVDVVGDVGEEE